MNLAHQPRRKYLITGVTGFLGRYVAKELRDLGFEVVGIGTSSEENAPTDLLDQYYRIRLPGKQLRRLLNEIGPDAVVHCAGRASIAFSMENPQKDYMGNTALCMDMLEGIRRTCPHAKFILLSSAAVYGNPAQLPVREDCQAAPLSPYGYHKLQAELLCQEYWQIYGLQTVVLRIFSAFGPGLRRQLLWDLVAKCSRSSKVVLQGTGQESRDFIHARDVATAVVQIAESNQCVGQVINIASGTETSVAQVANLIASRFKGIELSFDGQVPDGVPSRWQACTQKLNAMGFQLKYPLTSSIDEYVNWARPLVQG